MVLSPPWIVRITLTVLQGLGILLTTWRIYIRLQIRRFWWEDALAAILLFTGVLWMISQWVYLLTDGLTSIVAEWIYSLAFTTIMTLVRMSILFSIIRIIHGSSYLLKFTYGCLAFFVACWVVLVVEKVAQCTSDNSWHHQMVKSGKPYCQVKAYISIFQFTTDCVAVMILVVLPLRMLWRVKLPRRQRRMILSIFTSSVVLAFGALFHTVGQFLDIFVIMVAGINLEVTLSLCVCNLLVIVTYTYRFLLHNRGGVDTTTEDTSDDDDFTTTRVTRPVSATSLYLTTVDLGIPTTGHQTTQTSGMGVSTSSAPTEGLSTRSPCDI